jgi:sRNA-binding carbon storage regulator CsrA
MPDGTEVIITVNQTTNSAVKLHFDAPETVTIRRKTDYSVEAE